MIPHIYNGNGTISLMIDGVMKPVDTAHKYYDEIKQALIDQDWDAIPGLVNIKEQVEAAINESTAKGKVVIDNGEVLYNGTRVHNSLTDRIVKMAKEGFDIGHMVKFLENLMDNPSFRAVNELYDFLEAGSIPITENGTFLSYKKIRNDWTDIHSGNFDNSVGSVAEMPRNMVDEDSSRTCSAGLHVCSYDYLPHFGWGSDNRVVICEINPADVVSIPADYNNTKMRVCRYEVIGEVEDYNEADILAKNAVVYTGDVRSGEAGTVDHTDYKAIGKLVESMLDSFEIDGDALAEICRTVGLNSYPSREIGRIADDLDSKRAGKKVAYYLSNHQMNAAQFVTELQDVSEETDEDEDYDSSDTFCGRCGESLPDGEVECEECGYWN